MRLKTEVTASAPIMIKRTKHHVMFDIELPVLDLITLLKQIPKYAVVDEVYSETQEDGSLSAKIIFYDEQVV